MQADLLGQTHNSSADVRYFWKIERQKQRWKAAWDWSLKTSRKIGKGERINPNDARAGIRRKKKDGKGEKRG